MLLKVEGIDVNHKEDGWTPLCVVQNGNVHAMHLLRAHGAITSVQLIHGANKGATMLWAAAWNGHIEAVKLCMQWGLDVAARYEDSRSPLDAAKEKDTAIVEYLESVLGERSQ